MINLNEEIYLEALRSVQLHPEARGDRTGVGTRSRFGMRMVFDLKASFPLLTTKKVHFKSVIEELLWMLRGETNVNTLNASIWDEWADEHGELGPVYGAQWRDWDGIDQIQGVVDSIKTDPFGRRHIVSAWNVAQLSDMALPPCHLLFQFYVENDGGLSCQIYQRSADMFLGVPFNIASYAALTHIVAHYTGLEPARLIWVGGDCHIYHNHAGAVAEQLARRHSGPLPQLALDIPEGCLFEDLTFTNFLLTDYRPQSAIKAEVAV